MTGDPADVLHAYLGALGALEPDAVLPYYHLPCIFIAPQGVVAALDVDTLRPLLAQFLAPLRSKRYRRTEVSGLDVRALASDLATCSGVFVRRDVDDREIGRSGFTYTMRRAAESWKIVVAALYAPMQA